MSHPEVVRSYLGGDPTAINRSGTRSDLMDLVLLGLVIGMANAPAAHRHSC